MSDQHLQPPLFPLPPPQPNRNTFAIVAVQVVILALINAISLAIGLSESAANQGVMLHVLLVAGGTVIQVIVLFLIALGTTIASSPRAPSWWIALGLIMLLAIPACWLSTFAHDAF